MSHRQRVSINGCLLFAAAAFLSIPQTAGASVPGRGIPTAEGKAPAATEMAAVSAPNDLGNCLQPGNLDPRVVPPCLPALGFTYTELSEAWWQWFFHQTAFPDGVSADCSAHQSGPVWFLVGAPTHINCTVPFGKLLFFPILNVECSSLEDPPFYGKTAAKRGTCAKDIMDTATGLAAEIDGKPVQNLTGYRIATPDFDFTVPDGNIANIPTTKSHSGKSSADGFYLLLTPLLPGPHTIHFTGTFPGFEYTLDTTYSLTVRIGK